MVWEASNSFGGFSEARPWLPVSTDHLHHAAEMQENDPGALLHHYRKMLAFRRAHPVLAKGAHDKVQSDGRILYFSRTHGDVELHCAFNLSDTPATHTPPAGNWVAVGAELGSIAPASDGKVHLGPWHFTLLRRT